MSGARSKVVPTSKAYDMTNTRLFSIAVLAASGLLLSSCNSPNIPPGNYGTVTGTVTSRNGQPVAGVVVEAYRL